MSSDGAVLLPANATAWERCNSSVSTRILLAPVSTILRERDPARCDASFVAPLAWERSIHFWRPGDDSGNRARVASSFSDHCLYGSPQALEAEIALDTGLPVTVVEFFQERDLAWPGFAVETVYTPGTPAPDMDAIYASTVKRCNVRDWPRVRPRVNQAAAPITIAGAHRVAIAMKVLTTATIPPGPFVGAAQRLAFQQKVLRH